jgi:hypothetical protein
MGTSEGYVAAWIPLWDQETAHNDGRRQISPSPPDVSERCAWAVSLTLQNSFWVRRPPVEAARLAWWMVGCRSKSWTFRFVLTTS